MEMKVNSGDLESVPLVFLDAQRNEIDSINERLKRRQRHIDELMEKVEMLELKVSDQHIEILALQSSLDFGWWLGA